MGPNLWVWPYRSQSMGLIYGSDLWVPIYGSSPIDPNPWVPIYGSSPIDPNLWVPIYGSLQFRSCMLKLLFCGRSPFGDDDDVSGSSQATQVSSVSSSHVAPA